MTVISSGERVEIMETPGQTVASDSQFTQQKSGLVERLCLELNQAAIRYCHWKSNARLDLTLAGINDLDLLIHRKDRQRFIEILFRLGFKRTADPSAPTIPGIANYYAFDPDVNRFIHVHAHFQLVVGHDATKNFRIPLEDAYLASARVVDGIRVPAPEFEFIVFVIRMVLKHLTWDAALRREGYLSKNENFELQYLREHTQPAEIDDLMRCQFSFLSQKSFDLCLAALVNKKISFRDRFNGSNLSHNLNGLSRISPMMDFFLKTGYRASHILGQLTRRKARRKVLMNGGLMIAIVGGDGAGKSTLINELHEWLSTEFDTAKVHFGKPPWSMTTLMIRSLLKIGRLVSRQPFQKAPVIYSNDPSSIKFPGVAWAIRECCTASDRLRLYRKVRRMTTNGKIVLMDRFPVENIKFMESPQIRRMYNGAPQTTLIQWLIQKEESYYRFISPPDLLLVIKVDPEISVQRKVEEEESSVRARAAEIWTYPWDDQKASILDGSLSKEEVLNQAKRLIWASL